MKLLSVPWMWHGISGDKRDFPKKVTALLDSVHNIRLRDPIRGASFVAGSGTSQSHFADTTFVDWAKFQSMNTSVEMPQAVVEAEASNEGGPTSESDADPATVNGAHDPAEQTTNNKRSRDGEDEKKNKKKKSEKEGPEPSSSEDPDGLSN